MFWGLDFFMIFCIDFLTIFDEKWPPKVVAQSIVFALFFDTFSRGGPRDARGPFLIDF